MTDVDTQVHDGEHADRPSTDDDAGVALVTVIGLSFVAMLLVVAALGAATNNLPSARFHQDSEAAIAAAEAGIEDFTFRLDRDPRYYLSDDADNDALDGWQEVPGGRPGGPSYHYSIDASETASSGFITVRSTGAVNGVQRTLESRIRRDGFLDRIYLTDYEVIDASAYHAEGSTTEAFYEHHCYRYLDQEWDDTRTFFSGSSSFGPLGSRTGRLSRVESIDYYDAKPGVSRAAARSFVDQNVLYCPPIRFVTGDTIDGPLHSNDGITTDGRPNFRGPVTTNYRYDVLNPVTSSDQLFVNQSAPSEEPTFAQGIRATTKKQLPPTNSEIRGFAEADGCVYFGPTYVHLYVDGSGPTARQRMTVNSPLTPSGGDGWCEVGRNLDPPVNGVIYVADRTTGSAPASHPLDMDDVGNRSTFGFSSGDAFVWGEVLGQYTVAAQNDVVIVSDVTYRNGTTTGDDVLGIVANDFVIIHHPVEQETFTRADGTTGTRWVNAPVRTRPPFTTVNATNGFDDPVKPSYADGATTWNDPTISAAIVALNHSFTVDNYALGSRYDGDGQDLTVRGVIAQSQRGPVGTSGSPGTGYTKDYRWDSRLRNLSPPFFIEPVQAAWVPRDFAEVDEPRDCAADEDPSEVQCLPPLP